MGRIVDIGSRIELVSMDPHFHEITIGLYRQEHDGAPVYRVHTYSGRAGADQRIAFVSNAMVALGGMAQTPDGLLRFLCGEAHELACRRVFLEACKLASGGELKARPLTILDRKSGLKIKASGTGSGEYRVGAEGEGKDGARRIPAIAGGLVKLGEMQSRSPDSVAFSCGHDHDAAVGLLLVRAPNVRAAVREQETAGARGVLAAPSQQR
ncbi:MAG: hypothetical protein J4F39_02820 [Candidatus Latescibacteria bacterium]|nr:hypothetical protein [Candidatus Latescibacterota bacterium]